MATLAVLSLVTIVGSAVLLASPTTRTFLYLKLRQVSGLVINIGGFVKNSYLDVVHQNKYNDRYDILKEVFEYLETTGIGTEVEEGLNERYLGNLYALGEIIKLLPSRRNELLLEKEPTMNALPTMKQAERYMKYATAVYGPDMMIATQIENEGTTLFSSSQQANISMEEMVAVHVGNIQKEDVLVADMEDGDSLDCLRHFVVVDHSEKAIVLAIRGTYSISSLFIDIAGFATDFCGGQAHAGIAHMARAVWNKADAAVSQKLREFPNGYSLVITGHSLGAAVACLITIMVYHDKLMPPDVSVKCMAYAPPPVFYPPTAAPEAVQNTICYVNNVDIVPSLSCNAFRRLIRTIVEVDQVFKDFGPYHRFQIQYGYELPPESLINAARNARTIALLEREGAPWLEIPARCIVWLEKVTTKDNDDRMYSVAYLDPGKYAQRLLDLDLNMMDEHIPAEYEAAFHSILSSSSSKKSRRLQQPDESCVSQVYCAA